LIFRRLIMALARLRKILSVYITDPVVSLLARTPLTPNAITWFSSAGWRGGGADSHR
jgi:hypothetical protein